MAKWNACISAEHSTMTAAVQTGGVIVVVKNVLRLDECHRDGLHILRAVFFRCRQVPFGERLYKLRPQAEQQFVVRFAFCGCGRAFGQLQRAVVDFFCLNMLPLLISCYFPNATGGPYILLFKPG